MLCTKAQLKFDVFEDLPAAKRQNVCLGLFHCINWFRELVSESQPIHSYQPCVCASVCVCVCVMCRCVRLLEKQMRT